MYSKQNVATAAALTITIMCVSLISLPRASEAATTLPDQEHVERRVRAFFADTPVMIEIARCESEFQQFTPAGVPLRGGWNGAMIGVFQFYEQIHALPAQALGFNLATLEGNLSYAKHIYSLSGTEPWMSSYECWKNAKTALAPITELTEQERERLLETIAALTKLVAALQKQLASA